ncbi:MAG: hypothetical protein AVDCRST_MAG25-409, partial [uncultured Rubrobacteraceae bacterium]
GTYPLGVRVGAAPGRLRLRYAGAGRAGDERLRPRGPAGQLRGRARPESGRHGRAGGGPRGRKQRVRVRDVRCGGEAEGGEGNL